MGIFNTIYGVFLILYLILYLSLHTLSRRNLLCCFRRAHRRAAGAFTGTAAVSKGFRMGYAGALQASWEEQAESAGARMRAEGIVTDIRCKAAGSQKRELPLLDRCPEVCYDGHIQRTEALAARKPARL